MKWVTIGLIFAATSPIQAEQFTYQKDMVVDLGESWSPQDPFAIGALNKCIEYQVSEKSPVATENYSESFVDTFSEFKSATSLSFSASGSGSYGLSKVSASASFQSIRDVFADNKSVVYVVTGSRSYNPVRLSDANLTSHARELLSQAVISQNSDEFYRKCGEAVVTSIAKETNISLAYIFTASNSSLKKKIKAAISAAVSSGGQKGSVDTNIMTAVSKIDHSVNLQVEILQAGTLDNSDSLKSIVGIEPGDIQQIRDALRLAINSITWRSSQIKTFTASRLSKFFDIPQQPDWKYVAKAFTKLDKIRGVSDSIVSRYLQLEDILDDADQARVTIKAGMRGVIEDEMDDLEDKLQILVDTARECFETKAVHCRVPRMKIGNKVLPFIDVEFGSFSKWSYLLTKAHYDSHSQVIYGGADFWPEFIIYNTKYLRSISLLRNGQVEAFLDDEQIREAVSNKKLTMQPHNRSSYVYHSHCWSGEWGEKCAPWAKNAMRHIRTLQTQGSDYYTLELIDVEGGKTEIAVPKLSETTF
ncbi:hypothetical protein N9D31_00430 [Oligoflexaceae bacterium]|nr:hypothetical protein [Oligoflexaceae bacterium]